MDCFCGVVGFAFGFALLGCWFVWLVVLVCVQGLNSGIKKASVKTGFVLWVWLVVNESV
jgi:hypothetical protein